MRHRLTGLVARLPPLPPPRRIFARRDDFRAVVVPYPGLQL
jgi:hypothetical protein